MQCVLGIGLAAGLPGTALGAQPGARQGGLEEVVVTASRREQLLSDTPIAVTALTDAELVRGNVADIRGLAFAVPGLTVNGDNQFATSPFAIRGIGSAGTGIGADDPVGVYVDGVYLGRPASNTFNFVDLERVEVLRGPQGTLYGRNATGGAISFVTKRPALDAAEAFAEISFGRFEAVSGRGFLMGPVSDRTGVKIAAAATRADGWARNSFAGAPPANPREAAAELFAERSTLVRASALHEGERYTLVLGVDHGSFTQNVPFKTVNAGLGDPDVYSVNALSVQNRSFGGIGLTAEVDLTDRISLTSITAFRQSEFDEVWDSDGSSDEVVRVAPTEEQSQWSQEFRLQNDTDARIRWMAGVYGFLEDSEGTLPSGVFAAFGRAMTNETEAYAAFGEVSFGLTPAARLTLGGRYSHEQKTFTFTSGPRTAPFPPPARDSESWSAFTPRAVFEYELGDALLYVSGSRGFKSGGFNLTSIDRFDPEFVWAYEAGVKAPLFGGRMLASAAAFAYDYTDLQVRITVRPGVVATPNAAEAEIRGFELETTTLLTDSLRLVANVNYLDATFTEFLQPVFGPTGAITGFVDTSGRALNRAPEWKAFVAPEWQVDLGNERNLTLRAEYAYEGSLFFTTSIVPVTGRDAIEIVNLRATLSLGERWDLGFSVDNATDERYIANIVPVGPNSRGFANEPRTWTLRMGYRL